MLKTTFNRCYLHAFASGALAISLAACGGGGGDGTQPATTSAAGSVMDATSGVVAATSADGASSNGAGAAASSAPADSAGGSTNTSTNTSTSTSTSTTTTSSGTAGAQPAAPASARTPFGQDAAQYTLSFADEFENGYNTSVWNDHVWYESSNSTKNYAVENGALKIWPQRDASGKFFNRTLDTDGKYYQTYGYFEIEARLPVGKGTWPAFWLFNHIGDRRPEIDIMEAYAGGTSPWGQMISGQPHPTAYGATIWRTGGVQAAFNQHPTPDLSAGFHKYGLKWEPNKVTFFFDGTAFYTVNITMSDPMYLLLDLWFGSASGTPDGSTPTGKDNSYVVNYIRAWKFK
jgi:beta-glucanase (GH16 family)